MTPGKIRKEMLEKMSDTIPEEMKLPTGSKLVLSSSPHVSASENLRKIMVKVIAALLPAAAAGVWLFGFRALLVIAVTVLSCVGAEALWCKLAKKSVSGALGDFSAVVTGVILALNLPATVPFYVPVIGAFLAIWLGKQVFGGLGSNPFNPAVVARVGLLIALPAAMTIWSPPRGMDKNYPQAEVFFGASMMEKVKAGDLDGVTCATPLGLMTDTRKIVHTGDSKELEAKAARNFDKVNSPELLKKYFWGVRPGCIGETCVPALLLGLAVLLFFRLVNWRVPLCFAGSTFLFAGVIHFFFPGVTRPALFHLLTGGLLIGAIFMATDMVTSPVTNWGCVLFGTGCGIITAVIRIWGNYPEGVSFAILLMNALVPFIDRLCTRSVFGSRAQGEEKK